MCNELIYMYQYQSSSCCIGEPVLLVLTAVGGSSQSPWEAGMWETASEGGHDCFTSSITVSGSALLSVTVASLSNTKTSCQLPKKQTTSVAQSKQNVASPPSPARGGRAELTFQRPAPKTSVNDGVRGEESHAVSPRRLDFRPDLCRPLIGQRGCVD